MHPPLLRNVIRGENEISFRAFLAAVGRPNCSVSALRGHEDVLRRIRRHLAPRWHETSYEVAFVQYCDDCAAGTKAPGGDFLVDALHLLGFDKSSYNTRADDQPDVSSDDEGYNGVGYVERGLGSWGNPVLRSLVGSKAGGLMRIAVVGHMDPPTDEIPEWISEASSDDLTDANGELLTEIELRRRFSQRMGQFCTYSENCGTSLLDGDTVFWCYGRFFGQSEECRYLDGFQSATMEELVERGLVDEAGNGILRKIAAKVLRERAAEDEVDGTFSE